MCEYLTEEYILDWISKNCLPQAVADEKHRLANEEADKVIAEKHIYELIETNERVELSIDDFSDYDWSFSHAMAKIGEHFKDMHTPEKPKEGIIPFYAKNEDKDSGRIIPRIVIENRTLIEKHKQETEAAKKAAEAEAKRIASEKKKAEYLAKQQNNNH